MTKTKGKRYWIKLWNELGGIFGLAELLESSWLIKKHKPTGKTVVWKKYGKD